MPGTGVLSVIADSVSYVPKSLQNTSMRGGIERSMEGAHSAGSLTYLCGMLAIANRSSLPGSFTTLHSSLKIMVARVPVS
jgi:hypothetical protein